jgi:hypothetical protein
MRRLGIKDPAGDGDRHRRHLAGVLVGFVFFLAALPAATVAVTPALAAAPSETKLEVNENCVEPDWPCWATPGSSQPAEKVTIAGGGSINFVDAGTAANIAWTGTAPTCEPGVPVAPTAPATGWEGKCAFTTPGTYRFESSTLFDDGIDNYTRYEVVVEGPTTGTTGEPGTTPGTYPGTTTGPHPAGESPAGSALSGTPRIGSSLRGGAVKGSLEVSKAGVGDRLEIELIATAASLGKAGHRTQVVGRSMSASVAAGRRSFSVTLEAAARGALERRHHLALKVKVTLTPADGEATVFTRSVTLHA